MDYEQYLKENDIFIKNMSDLEPPILNYISDSRLPDYLIEKMNQLNFIVPTPIQSVSIPIIMKGKDLIGISKTGSGKTLAFLLPAMEFLSKNDTKSVQEYKPRMLVISPTRELALQTYEVFEKFNLFPSICVYGGSSRTRQYMDIKSRKPPVIIGTPGRINDFIEVGLIFLDECKYLVLDEADRMFDMGFYPQIKKIIDLCPDNQQRQTLLFSATWTEKVQELANGFLNLNPILISIGRLYELRACSDIKQHLFLVSELDKKKLLQKILEKFEGFKILVFTNTKLRCQIMSDFCNDLKLTRSDFIHGDVSQERRESLIKNFNCGKLKVIFASDVAARGLDIKDIHVVVNYDFPVDVETYVHRIGRCGRNGAKGLAFTFITKKFLENPRMQTKLAKVVKESGNSVPDFLSSN